VSVPVGLVGESLINAVVEVLVVRENNVTANIVELWYILGIAYSGNGADSALRSLLEWYLLKQDHRESRWSQ